jgi:hypothetical protein
MNAVAAIYKGFFSRARVQLTPAMNELVQKPESFSGHTLVEKMALKLL